MTYLIKLSRSDDKDFPIIAERVVTPKDIGWKTEIKFDDGIQGFATIDRKYIKLLNGATIEKSYEAVRGHAPSFMEKMRKPEINIYAYQQIISGCSVGGRFHFVDIRDGKEKYISTFWHASLSLLSAEKLIKEISAAEKGQLTVIECNKALREKGNLHAILEEVLVDELKVVPIDQISARYTEIGKKVKDIFRQRGGSEATGFDIAELTVGHICIAN